MPTWHPSNEPYTAHNPPRYWAGVLDILAGHTPRPTTGVRKSEPQVLAGQPALTRVTVGGTSSGLADGPSGQ